MLLVSLVGEQPIPNLLPIRYLKPDENLLVYTQRTEAVARRLQRILAGTSDLKAHLNVLDPYNYSQLHSALRKRLEEHDNIIFNLTGGTKIMMLAAYDLAARLNHPFVYIQSEGHKSILQRYDFQDGMSPLEQCQELPALITAEEYLHAYLPGFRVEGVHRDETGKVSDGGCFEQAILNALQSRLDQVLAGVRPEGVGDQIEIDLVLRVGNQVGIAEVKLGGKESWKRGLDQLKMAGEQTYLGTYTAQFLISAGTTVPAKIATLAAERKVGVILVPHYQNGLLLSKIVADRVADQIRKRLS